MAKQFAFYFNSSQCFGCKDVCHTKAIPKQKKTERLVAREIQFFYSSIIILAEKNAM